MMRYRAKLMQLILLFFSFSLSAADFRPQTEKYLEAHPIEEIKYYLRLDNVSLSYKDLFDKLVPKETEGFIGYHGDSLEYRIYQDLIRVVLEEVVGMDIPSDFHFLDIPCFREQVLQELKDIPNFFQPEKDRSVLVQKQLFPVDMNLYCNHNRIGYSSVVNFTLNQSQTSISILKADLKEFFQMLGLDRSLVDEAFIIGKSSLKDDRGILLQIFDGTTDPYSFANRVSYPSFPNSYPFQNRAIAEYYYENTVQGCPNELRIVLTDRYTLNPTSPLIIKRFDKIQSSVIKNYEASLRELIKKAKYDPQRVEDYYQKLIKAWMQ